MTKVEHLTEVQKLDSRVLLGGYVDDLLSRWSTLFVGGLRAPYMRVCYISLRNTTEQKRVDSHHPQDISSTRHWCFQACFEKGIHRKPLIFLATREIPSYYLHSRKLMAETEQNPTKQPKCWSSSRSIFCGALIVILLGMIQVPPAEMRPQSPVFLCDWKATTEELQGPPRCQYVPGFVSNAVSVTGVRFTLNHRIYIILRWQVMVNA